MPADVALSQLAQIALPVRDVERAVAFYRDALGMRLLFQAPPGLAFFDAGGVRLMLSAPEGVEGPGQGGTVLYFRVDDLEGAHEALVARGVKVVQAPHVVARLETADVWLAFITDSEGNVLGLMSEVPRA